MTKPCTATDLKVFSSLANKASHLTTMVCHCNLVTYKFYNDISNYINYSLPVLIVVFVTELFVLT